MFIIGIWFSKDTGNHRKISTEILDVTNTGATVVITDFNEESYVYEECYKIENEEDGKWLELATTREHYGYWLCSR
ncbi:MAG: hypothetical protein PUF50_07780 [Erysipelotrichaceae bacterium]|nr:hypothetical protein [Erysipelotrichaceae bacterium]